MAITQSQYGAILRAYAAVERRTLAEAQPEVDRLLSVMVDDDQRLKWKVGLESIAARQGLNVQAPPVTASEALSGRRPSPPRRLPARAAAPQPRRFPEPALTTIAAPRLAR